MLEPGIDVDVDSEQQLDAAAEHLPDAEGLAPVDGPGPAGLPGDDCGTTDIFDDEAVNAKLDRFLAELAEGVQALREDHPMRVFCKMLHRGRDGFRKARAVKKASDEFRTDLGLPDLP
jgi:hypothetical protein